MKAARSDPVEIVSVDLWELAWERRREDYWVGQWVHAMADTKAAVSVAHWGYVWVVGSVVGSVEMMVE